MSAGELPAVLPVETFLANSPKATIDLSAIYVYSDHCEFDMTWALRRTPEELKVWQEHVADDIDYQFQGRYAGDPEFSRLRCIAELADGSILPDFAGGVLGSTSMSHGDASPALEPLPPSGELRITLDWPEFGIHNVVTILDATAINQAARRVQPL
ncbi:hypothetical protein [Flindersiella endophytica]